MDIEYRLHGRLFSKQKCDAIAAGPFAGGKNLMRPPWLFSDPEHVHCGLWNPSPPRASPSFRSCVQRRIVLLIQLLLIIVDPSSAALINVENCLSPDIINDNTILQFIPMFANAVFNATTTSHNLNVTVYGNITGGLSNNKNSSQSDGMIPDLGIDPHLGTVNQKATTLLTSMKVLDYSLYHPQPARFCNSTVNSPCPLGPATIQ